jgi:hypothetical protein
MILIIVDDDAGVADVWAKARAVNGDGTAHAAAAPAGAQTITSRYISRSAGLPYNRLGGCRLGNAEAFKLLPLR